MIDVHVLDVRPHPDQATNNPGCWAVQLRVTRAGRSRTFWRWYTVREFSPAGRLIAPSSERKPSKDEILSDFWDDTFGELHGFDFDKDDP